MFRRIKIETVLGALMIAAMLLLAAKGWKQAVPTEAGAEKLTVAVDAGHGGDDPGKIGINGALEKDINLSIAKKLQKCLEKSGIRAVMIREDEKGLYDSSAPNKKQDDMRKRCEKIDSSNPVFTVSVHQNSYTSESVHGPQVFYYTHSAEGQEAAKAIQDAMNELLQVDRPREIKGNETYYLLKKTKSPTIIVECGFLSNNAEAEKLVTEEYQEQVAEAICAGVLKCLEGQRQ